MACRVLSLIALSFALTTAALAQSFGTTGAGSLADARNLNSVSGLIRTGEGRPAKDAHIEIHDRQSGRIVAQTYANSSGLFEVNVPAGVYEVVGQLGLEEARETVSVQAADAMISLRLPGVQQPQSGDRFSVSVKQLTVPEKARKALRKAQAALDKENLEQASKYVGEALEVHPEYSEALTLRGILKLDGSQFKEALADFQKAVEYDANYATAYLALGAAYNALSQFDEALRVLDRGLGLSPASWQGYFEMGKAFLGKANYEASIRQLNKAENLQPKYPLIHLVKAHAWLGMKNYPQAMGELEFYLEQNPQGKDSAGARETLERVRSFSVRK